MIRFRDIWAIAAFAAVLAVGCERSDEEYDREVDHDLVEIDREHLRLRTDAVGVGTDAQKPTATFVLVDARNTSDRPLMITLGGELVNEAGEPIAALRPDSLRVPPASDAGPGVRTFALVQQETKAVPEATGARVHVAGAWVPDYDREVVIEDGGAYLDQNRVVVNGHVVNTADRRVKAIVIAGFYDEDGNVVERPFQVLTIGAGAERGVQFVGPEGSTKGYMFIGDAVY